ncbi:MAG: hypothetical protein IKQ67_07300 [Candidatus Methanomethylophilaceae archaeon]|nr:hypothetical protein [Candidatus Methanomethylophilaceae archaeon]
MTSSRKDVRIRRETADRLLEGLREHILLANANDSFCYRIKRAVVFGSYVNDPDKDTLGDLDIGIEFEAKYPPNSEEFRNKEGECRSSSWFAAMAWPKEEVVRYLRNRSGYISIHDMVWDRDAVFSKDILELEVSP